MEQTEQIGSLRIGLFSDVYLPQINGVSISLQLISEGLKNRGHQVTIFAPKFPGYKDTEPNIMRLPSLKYMNNPPIYVAVLGSPRSTWSLTTKHFDVLHAHSPLSVGLLAYLTASTKRLPLIYTYHTSITDYTHYVKFIGGTSLMKHGARWFSSTTTNLGDQIVVPSPKFERLLLKQKVTKPIHVIPNGIDLTRFQATPKAGDLRNRLQASTEPSRSITPEAPILLTVGRMDPEKRLDFIIDAFVKISKQIPNAQLVFAGDGSARKDLEEKVNALDIKNKIHFLGMVNRNELPNIYHDATLFLSASTTEVHPISVIEAIASGLPLVAVQDEAFEGMLENDLNGYLTPLDVNVYAETIIKLLQDDKKIKAFGKHSAMLSEKYSIEGQVKALEKLYTEAILQNWRSNFISRMIPKEIKELNKIPRKITQEISKILPKRKAK